MKGCSDTVAVFWDYGAFFVPIFYIVLLSILFLKPLENCSAPSNGSGFAIASNIFSLARPFGSIKVFKAYLEISDQPPFSRSLALRSELQSSGVTLVDCPHNGRKEVADKMIIGQKPIDFLWFLC